MKELTNRPYKIGGKQLKQYEDAAKRASIEHAPGVRVRMNPQTFRIEYIDQAGNIVSSHI